MRTAVVRGFAPEYEWRTIPDLRDLVTHSAATWPDRTAFLARRNPAEPPEPISYPRFQRDLEALGSALVRILGLGGDFIAITGENRYEWLLSYLAAACGAGVAVPLDRELPPHEAVMLLQRCRASVVVYSGRLAATMESIRDQVPTVRFWIDMDAEADAPGGRVRSFRRLLEAGRALADGREALSAEEKVLPAMEDVPFLKRPLDPESLAILLFTSGTTSTAKGVMLSHRNLCADISMIQGAIFFNQDDVILSILPIHHTYECTMLLSILSKGGTVAFCDGLRHIAKNLREYRPQCLTLVPLVVENLYRKIQEGIQGSPVSRTLVPLLVQIGRFFDRLGLDARPILFSKIHAVVGGRHRVMVVGAAALDPDLWQAMTDFGFRIRQGYGMTEASPVIATERDLTFRKGTVGPLVPGMEGCIDDPDPVAGIGEIMVRGPNIMMGYFGDEEATREALQDGWLRTGDLGRFDADGFLSITGRKKNVIVLNNGKKVFPEELEALLARSPLVLECMVYGETVATTGSDGAVVGAGSEVRVKATVFPDMKAVQAALEREAVPGDEVIRKLLREEIRKVNGQVPGYKRIEELDLRDTEFEKTTTRKIKRHANMA